MEFGSRIGAIASSVYSKRITNLEADDDEGSKLTAKSQEEAGGSARRLKKKSQSPSEESNSDRTRLTARRVERKSFLRAPLAQKREHVQTRDISGREGRDVKRSSGGLLEQRGSSKKRSAALHLIRALEARAADKLPEERAVMESDRLAAREERLRAVEELVVQVRLLYAPEVRSPTPAEDDEDLLEDRTSGVAGNSSSENSTTSSNSPNTSPYLMRGTMVYEANTNMTATWCRRTCDEESYMCASFLFIEDNGICVFHFDIE